MNPSISQIQTLAARNKAFTGEATYRRNFNEEAVNLKKVTPPEHFKPLDQAVSKYIIKKLRKDTQHRFNSDTIAKSIHSSAITVKRCLKRLQRSGYLRINRLKSGHTTYNWSPKGNNPQLTTFDACKQLAEKFPESIPQVTTGERSQQTRPTLTKKDALWLAEIKGVNSQLAAGVWNTFLKAGCVTEPSWERHLDEIFPDSVPF